MFAKNKLMGYMFSLIHALIMYLIVVIALFSKDFFVLYSIAIILVIIIYLNYLFNDCPLTLLEEYHLDFSSVNFFNYSLPMKYDSERRPEVTLQWVVTGLILVLTKILILLVFKTLRDLQIELKL
jgi:hypothetical protein